MLVLTPALTIVSVPVGGLNLMVVPVGAAVKLLGPKREPDVLPKGLEVVFVVPKSPPLLVLVPENLYVITQASLKPTAAINTRGDSHLGPVPGAEAVSLCPHQGHTGFGMLLYRLWESGFFAHMHRVNG